MLRPIEGLRAESERRAEAAEKQIEAAKEQAEAAEKQIEAAKEQAEAAEKRAATSDSARREAMVEMERLRQEIDALRGLRGIRPMRQRRPRLLLRTLFVVMALVTAAVWWLTDQPRRRAKAIRTTQNAGGFYQRDREYRTDWRLKPPPRIDLASVADTWIGPAFRA